MNKQPPLFTSGSEQEDKQTDTKGWGGDWTKTKLKILDKYANAYTKALKKQNLKAYYIDAFAGQGWSKHKTGNGEQEYLKGSPLRALESATPFHKYIFVEVNKNRIAKLEEKVAELRTKAEKEHSYFPKKEKIKFIPGDINSALEQIIKQYNGGSARFFLFIDPFATEFDVNIVKFLLEEKVKMDVLYLFPAMAASRLMPRGKIPSEKHKKILERVMGEGVYLEKLYKTRKGLFEETKERPKYPKLEKCYEIFADNLKQMFPQESEVPYVLDNKLILKNKGTLFHLCFFCTNSSNKARNLAFGIANDIIKSEQK